MSRPITMNGRLPVQHGPLLGGDKRQQRRIKIEEQSEKLDRVAALEAYYAVHGRLTEELSEAITEGRRLLASGQTLPPLMPLCIHCKTRRQNQQSPDGLCAYCRDRQRWRQRHAVRQMTVCCLCGKRRKPENAVCWAITTFGPMCLACTTPEGAISSTHEEEHP